MVERVTSETTEDAYIPSEASDGGEGRAPRMPWRSLNRLAQLGNTETPRVCPSGELAPLARATGSDEQTVAYVFSWVNEERSDPSTHPSPVPVHPWGVNLGATLEATFRV